MSISIKEAEISKLEKSSDEIARILEECNNDGVYNLPKRQGSVSNIWYVASDEFLDPRIQLSFKEFDYLGRPKRICKETKISRTIYPVNE